jgi:CBS domain-containing protein
MARVTEILQSKGAHVHCISAEATVFHAIEKMVEYNVGALIVKDGHTVSGIFTERDHLRRVTLGELDPRTTRVREVMTPRLVCVQPATTVEDCMAVMTRERIRHLPVVGDEEVVGLVSIGDLVKHVSSEQLVEIRYLTEFITGGRAGT